MAREEVRQWPMPLYATTLMVTTAGISSPVWKMNNNNNDNDNDNDNNNDNSENTTEIELIVAQIIFNSTCIDLVVWMTECVVLLWECIDSAYCQGREGRLGGSYLFSKWYCWRWQRVLGQIPRWNNNCIPPVQTCQEWKTKKQMNKQTNKQATSCHRMVLSLIRTLERWIRWEIGDRWWVLNRAGKSI